MSKQKKLLIHNLYMHDKKPKKYVTNITCNSKLFSYNVFYSPIMEFLIISNNTYCESIINHYIELYYGI